MGRRRRLLVVGMAVTAVAVLVVATSRRDRPVQTLEAGPPDTATSSTELDTTTTASAAATTTTDEPSTSTAARPKPTSTTTAPAVRTTLGSDAKGTWTLVAVDGPGRPRCLELRVDTFTSPPVLCGSAAPTADAVVGDLVTFDTPKGRAMIVLVHPRVETFGYAYVQAHAPLVRSDDGQVAYAVRLDVHPNLQDNRLWQYFGIGTNIVAETRLPIVEGTVHPGASTTSTAPPFGIYSGYRSVGTTGLYWGGNEDFGFYDAPDRSPCFLYRRIGGEPAAVLIEQCTPSVALGVAHASLRPKQPAMNSGAGGRTLLVVVDGLDVATWSCALPSGASCGAFTGPSSFFSRAEQLATDSKPGSHRQVIGTWPGGVNVGDADHVTVTLFDRAGAVVADVPVAA